MRALAVHAAVALADGRADQALDLASQAVTIQRDTGHRLGEAHALVIAGRARRATDGLPAAEPTWRTALEIFDEVGAGAPTDVRALLRAAPRASIPA